MLLNANLYKLNYNIIIYNIKVKKKFEDIKKEEAKILIKRNKKIYLKITIKNIK